MNELIVVHVSAHLTMVKSLYRVHVYARRKGGGGEQNSGGKEKEPSKKTFVSFQNQMLVLCFKIKLHQMARALKQKFIEIKR